MRAHSDDPVAAGRDWDEQAPLLALGAGTSIQSQRNRTEMQPVSEAFPSRLKRMIGAATREVTQNLSRNETMLYTMAWLATCGASLVAVCISGVQSHKSYATPVFHIGTERLTAADFSGMGLMVIEVNTGHSLFPRGAQFSDHDFAFEQNFGNSISGSNAQANSNEDKLLVRPRQDLVARSPVATASIFNCTDQSGRIPPWFLNARVSSFALPFAVQTKTQQAIVGSDEVECNEWQVEDWGGNQDESSVSGQWEGCKHFLEQGLQGRNAGTKEVGKAAYSFRMSGSNWTNCSDLGYHQQPQCGDSYNDNATAWYDIMRVTSWPAFTEAGSGWPFPDEWPYQSCYRVTDTGTPYDCHGINGHLFYAVPLTKHQLRTVPPTAETLIRTWARKVNASNPGGGIFRLNECTNPEFSTAFDPLLQSVQDQFKGGVFVNASQNDVLIIHASKCKGAGCPNDQVNFDLTVGGVEESWIRKEDQDITEGARGALLHVDFDMTVTTGVVTYPISAVVANIAAYLNAGTSTIAFFFPSAIYGICWKFGKFNRQAGEYHKSLADKIRKT